MCVRVCILMKSEHMYRFLEGRMGKERETVSASLASCVSGCGYRVSGFGFRVSGLGLSVQGLEFRV